MHRPKGSPNKSGSKKPGPKPKNSKVEINADLSVDGKISSKCNKDWIACFREALFEVLVSRLLGSILIFLLMGAVLCIGVVGLVIMTPVLVFANLFGPRCMRIKVHAHLMDLLDLK